MNTQQASLSADLISKAKWIADNMQADGITQEKAALLGEAAWEELCVAYMASLSRKIEAMQSIYLTNREARDSMREFVYATSAN